MKAVTLRFAAIAAVFILLVVPTAVGAHSEFESGTPANGATVGTGPIDIVGTFSEELAPKSHMELLDASGNVVARAAIDGNEMRIGLEGLQPGQYQVRWTSVADDGDVLRGKPGDWTFTVEGAAASVSASASAAAPSASVPEPSPSVAPTLQSLPPGSDTSGSTSTNDVLLPVVAAIVVIALLGTWLLRRRSAIGR
jgi:copper resistance protein C